MMPDTAPKQELIAMRHESVVGREGEFVDKTYRPDQVQSWVDKYGEVETPNYLANQRGYFNHEHAIVKAFAALERAVTPTLVGVDRESLTLRFSNVDYPLYQDDFHAIWSNERLSAEAKERAVAELTEEMILKVLVPFHNYANENMARLVAGSRLPRSDFAHPKKQGKQKVMLRMRNEDERVDRLGTYFKELIFNRSSELDAYFTEKGIDPETADNKLIRQHLSFFSRKYKVNKRIRELEERDRKISGRQANFVAGDFRPQNIFRTQDVEKILVFDFDKARRGSSTIDLYHGINNIHRFPFTPNKEAFSLELAGEYFSQTGTPSESLPIKIARYIATGILEDIRWWAYHCKPYEFEAPNTDILHYFGNREPYSSWDEETLREKMVTDFYPQEFTAKSQFYRYREGEGWYEALEAPLLSTEGLDKPTKESRRELLQDIKKQRETVEDILKDTGCLQGKASSQKRASRIRRIFV